MSVALTTPPPALSLSADKITAKFTCTGVFDQVGVKAVNTLILSNLSPGTELVLQYGSEVVTMTAVLAPDDSGYQFYAYDGGIATPIWMQVDRFKDNYILSRDFDITEDGSSSILFTAKKTGIGYNIAGFNTTPGAAEIVKANYGIIFKLYLENAENTGFELIYESTLTAVIGSVITAEAIIDDKIHNSISAEIFKNLPDIPGNTPLICKKTCRRYYFEFYECYGEPLQVRKRNASDVYTVSFGDLSYRAQILKDLPSLIAPGTANQDRFLTQALSPGFTRSNQRQYLYFLNTRATKPVYLKCKFYFRDDTSQVINLYNHEMLELRKYGYNVTFDQIFVQADFPDMVVTRYDIYLSDAAGNNLYSEVRSYYLDYSAKQYVRYFLNYSSWGGLDSRVFYGRNSSEIELSQSEVDRSTVDVSDIRQGTSIVFNLSLRTKYKLTTGFYNSRSELIFNRDFFLSALKYRVVKDLMLPVKVTSKNVSELHDGENLLAQEFEYEYLFEDNAYTEGDVDEPGIILEGITIGQLQRDSVKIYDYYGALVATVLAPGEYHITEQPGGEPPSFAYVIPENNHLDL